jgi:hypothetical protein
MMNLMMRVHGIDLGMRSLYVFGTEGPYTVEVPKTTRHDELKTMAIKVSHRFDIGDVIFYEDPIAAGSRNLQTLIGLSQTSGMLLTAASGHCYKVAVATWKKETVGKGNAKKEEVAAWLELNEPEMFALCGGNQNLIDAACIKIYGNKVIDRLSSAV